MHAALPYGAALSMDVILETNSQVIKSEGSGTILQLVVVVASGTANMTAVFSRWSLGNGWGLMALIQMILVGRVLLAPACSPSDWPIRGEGWLVFLWHRPHGHPFSKSSV